MFKKAFTLAEVLIALTIIGVIGAVTPPSIVTHKPDKKLAMFKKGSNMFGDVISALVSSGDYYKDNNLSMQKNRQPTTDDAFCKEFSKYVSVKKKNCNVSGTGYCNRSGNYIVTTEGIVFYDPSPSSHFSTGGYKTIVMYTTDDCNDTESFSFSVRADGKIEYGTKELEWLNKSLRQ